MQETASLKISVDTKDIKSANSELDKLTKTSGQTEKATSGVSSSFISLNKVLAVGSIAAVAAQYIKFADTMTGIQSKLKLVTSSTQELTTAQSELFKIAQTTRQGYAETVDTYSNFAVAMGEMGKSQKDILRVTETVNKAIAISGGTAQQAAAATMQLGQAFASGTLRGDELNSILENSKGLAQAIADGMGVPIGKLRTLGSEGKITAEILATALEKSAKSVDDKFSKVAVTVEQSMTVMTNGLLAAVGEMDNAMGASSGLSSALTGLGNVFSDVAVSLHKFNIEVSRLQDIRKIKNLGDANIALQQIDDEIKGLTTSTDLSDRMKRSLMSEVQIRGNLNNLYASRASLNKKVNVIAEDELKIQNKKDAAFKNRVITTPIDKKAESAAKKAAKEAERLREEKLKAEKEYAESLQGLNDAGFEFSKEVSNNQKKFKEELFQQTASDYEKEMDLISQKVEAIKGAGVTESEIIKYRGILEQNYLESIYLESQKQFDELDKDMAKRAEEADKLFNFSYSIELDPTMMEGTAKAIAGVGKSMSSLIKIEAQYNKSKKITGASVEAIAKNEKEHTIAQLEGYSNMAGAMSSMFKEGSKEAEAFHIAQVALAAVSGVIAIMEQGKGDPYTAFGRIAAMAAVIIPAVASIGGSISAFGGGGGGSSAPITNSGTVLGDSSAISESTTNIVSLLEDIHVSEYSELRDINRAVTSMAQGIESAITNIFRGGTLDTSGVSLKSSGIALTDAMTPSLKTFITDPLKIMTNLTKSVFGNRTKQTIAGSGFNIGAGTLGSKAAGNVGASTFVDVETMKKKAWGSTSYSHNITTKALDKASSNSISLIYKSFSDTMLEINKGLGTNLAPAISKYALSAIKLNLQGKTGDEAVKALNDSFSALGDKMSSDIFGSILNKYQKLGEGLLETAVRVITEKAVVIQDLGDIGKTVSGDVIGISQSLVTLSGSLGYFQDNIATYYDKYFTDEEKLVRSQTKFTKIFSDLGYTLPTSAQSFRGIVDALNLSTTSGQETFTTLMGISGAFYSFSESAKEVISNTDTLKTSLFDNIKSFIDSVSGDLTTKDPTTSFYQFTSSFNEMIDAISSGSDNLLDVGSTALSNAQNYLNIVTATATSGRDIQFAKAMLVNKFSGVIATPDTTLNTINSTLNANNALLVNELQALKFELNSIKEYTITQAATSIKTLSVQRSILGETVSA